MESDDPLSLEKLRIRDDLTVVKEKILAHMEDESKRQKMEDERWRRVEEVLFGDNHNPGLMSKVNTMYTIGSMLMWVTGALVVAVLGLFTGLARDVMAAIVRR